MFYIIEICFFSLLNNKYINQVINMLNYRNESSTSKNLETGSFCRRYFMAITWFYIKNSSASCLFWWLKW